MRAPRGSDTERCNNIQYVPDDGGFHPRAPHGASTACIFHKAWPGGNRTPKYNNGSAASSGELHRKR